MHDCKRSMIKRSLKKNGIEVDAYTSEKGNLNKFVMVPFMNDILARIGRTNRTEENLIPFIKQALLENILIRLIIWLTIQKQLLSH